MDEMQRDELEQRVQQYYDRARHVTQPDRARLMAGITARISEEAGAGAKPASKHLIDANHSPHRKGTTFMLPENVSSTRRRPSFSIAVVLLIVLIAASGVWFGYAHSQAGLKGTSPAAQVTATATPTKTLATVTDKGITLDVLRIEMNGLRTLIFTSAEGYIADGFQLTDQHGDTFGCYSGSYVNTSGSVNEMSPSLEECAPVPLADLGSTVNLGITVTKMDSHDWPQQFVKGTWRVTVPVSVPVADYSSSLTIAPVTLHGITIQPAVVVVVKGTAPTAQQANGIYVRLHIDATASAYFLCGMNWDAYFRDTTGAGYGQPGSQGEVHMNVAQLTVPGATNIIPNAAPLSLQYCPGSADQTYASPTNSIDQELMWFFPISTLPSQITVTVTKLSVATKVNPFTAVDVDGPWTFTIPLH